MTRSIGSRRRSRRLRKVLITGCIAPLVAISACAKTQSAEGGGSFGPVPANATKQEYVKALQGMDPVTMTVQTLAPKGSPDSAPMKRYAGAIEEWSGGKITVEIAYSSSIASLPDAGEALADGRLDFARHAPLYNPDEFPETNALVDLTFVGRHTPLVGRLQRYAAFIETGLKSEKIMSELNGHGLKPAFPLAPITPMVVLACKSKAPTTLGEMNGLVARASGRIHARQLKALGITSADLDITEIYQGLQRGVIDCGEMSLSTLELVGAIKVANKISYHPKAGFADTPGAYSFNQNFWDELPLPAQQLLWDRLEVFVTQNLEHQVKEEADAVQRVASTGGAIQKWNSDVVRKIRSFNQKVMQDARQANPELVKELMGNISSWKTVVTRELGYEDGGSFSEIPTWYAPKKVSMDRFVAKFMTTVMKPHRPE